MRKRAASESARPPPCPDRRHSPDDGTAMHPCRQGSSCLVAGAGFSLAEFRRRDRACGRGSNHGHDQLPARWLGATLGHRVPHRYARFLRLADRDRHGRTGAAVRERECCTRDPRGEDRPFLCSLHAGVCRAGRHRRHRRCFQHLCLSRDLIAGILRTDQHGQGPQGIECRLSVPGDGHHRCDLHPDRYRFSLHDDRHPEHPGSRGAPACCR